MRVECVCRSCTSVIPYVIRRYLPTQGRIRLRFARNNADETPSPLGRRRSEKTAVTNARHNRVSVLLFRYSIPKSRVSSSFNLHTRRARPLM